ncbi:MAG: hypothetical protein HY053_01325 [Proteobacteria bacterium]|nr:hypothetical protein [Pseudomonadota bacterium]
MAGIEAMSPAAPVERALAILAMAPAGALGFAATISLIISLGLAHTVIMSPSFLNTRLHYNENK